jgi:hypothetical protein
MPTTFDIYNTLIASLFQCGTFKPSLTIRSRSFTDKITLLKMIEKLEEPITAYSSDLYKNRNLLHIAVCYGDTDILLAILEKKGADSLLNDVDLDNKTPLEAAIDQGVPLNAIIVFLANLNHLSQQFERDITLQEFRELRKTETDSDELFNAALDFAQKTFYLFLQDQLRECLTQINPLEEDSNEKIISKIRLLATDFLHESWIGAPDSGTPAYEIAGLESKKEIEDFILDWCETNPVAAMRCLYVYECLN